VGDAAGKGGGVIIKNINYEIMMLLYSDLESLIPSYFPASKTNSSINLSIEIQILKSRISEQQTFGLWV